MKNVIIISSSLLLAATASSTTSSTTTTTASTTRNLLRGLQATGTYIVDDSLVDYVPSDKFAQEWGTSGPYADWMYQADALSIGSDGKIQIKANCDLVLAGQFHPVGLVCTSLNEDDQLEIETNFAPGTSAIINQMGIYQLAGDIETFSPGQLPNIFDGTKQSVNNDLVDLFVENNEITTTGPTPFTQIKWTIDIVDAQLAACKGKNCGTTWFFQGATDLSCSDANAEIPFYLVSHFTMQGEYTVGGQAQGVDGETAWTSTKPPSGGNWGKESMFTFICQMDPPGGETPPPTAELVCGETGFGFLQDSSVCFSELNSKIKRWGWTTPLSPLGQTFDIFAGAAKCDTAKGTKVGTVTVDQSGSITYSIDSGYALTEIHAYIGDEPFPQVKKGKKMVDTVAPGKYTYVKEFPDQQTGEIQVPDLLVAEGNYVIFHGVFCGPDF